MSDHRQDRRKFMAASAAGLSGVMLGGCAVFDSRGWKSMVGEAVGMASQPLPPLRDGDGEGIDEQWFKDFIRDFTADASVNCLGGDFPGEPIFKGSLTGFVRGDDPLLDQYKTIIGPFHHTAEEAIMWAAHEQRVKAPAPEDSAVVSFVLPLSDAIVADNAKQDRWCSARWAHGRLFGELFCRKMTAAMLEALAGRGVLAVAPDLMPDFRKQRYPGVGWASPWSHRHLAFAAGLGSFGMNDFFISEAGAAHRTGSIVVARRLEPDRERPPHYRHNCLHYQTGECLECAARCPVGATSPAGHDKNKCSMNVLGNVTRNQIVNNVNIYGCGLCATGTPCSQQSPAA